MLNTLPRQNLAKPNDLGDICEKLLSDPPLSSILVTAPMFFDKSKIPTSDLCKIPQETFKPRLVSISQVVSEEKNFERNNIKNGKNR